jgi:hypothetical protein
VACVDTSKTSEGGAGQDSIICEDFSVLLSPDIELDFHLVNSSDGDDRGVILGLMDNLLFHLLRELLSASKDTIPLGVVRKLEVKRLENSLAMSLVIPVGSSGNCQTNIDNISQNRGVLPVECFEPLNGLIVVWRCGNIFGFLFMLTEEHQHLHEAVVRFWRTYVERN